MEKIIQKEGRQQATHLCNSPRDFEKEDKKAAEILKIKEYIIICRINKKGNRKGGLCVNDVKTWCEFDG